MFTSLAGLGLLIGGLGRIGMSVLNFLFNYLLKKQEIKLTELKSNSNKFSEVCNFECKFNPDSIEDKIPQDLKPLEIEQPKRFYFITIIFSIAVIGVMGSIALMYIIFTDIDLIEKNISDLYDHCWVVIGFIVSWVLTDKATIVFKR